jgi:glycine cleavage system H protein
MPDLTGYRFAATHEWARVDGDQAKVGISDHAHAQLGDVIFLELPAVGATFKAGAKFGVIESVKAASDLYTPVGGTVSAVNESLTDNPERVNQDPYGEGWLIRLESVEEGGVELVDEAAYTAQARS